MTTMTRIRSLDDLIGFLPHLLGHHPSDALVLVATQRTGHLATGRIPLVDDETRVPFTVEEVVETAGHAVRTFADHGADGVYAVAFASAERAVPILAGLVPEAEAAGVEVHDVVAVHEGRHFLPRSPDARERVEGIPLSPGAVSDSALVHLVDGSDPLPDRGAVRALVLADGDRARGVAEALIALEQVAARSVTRPRRVAARQGRLWARVLASGIRANPVTELTDHQVAQLLLSLRDVHWRDALIVAILPGTLEWRALKAGDRRAAHRWFGQGCDDPRVVLQRLLELARRAPDEATVSAGVCALVGCVAWHLGNGATARDAVERALRIDPAHRLAQLLQRMVDHGIRPPRSPASGRAMAPADRPAV